MLSPTAYTNLAVHSVSWPEMPCAPVTMVEAGLPLLPGLGVAVAAGGGGAASTGRVLASPSNLTNAPETQPWPSGAPVTLMANQVPAAFRPMAGTFSPVLRPPTEGYSVPGPPRT